MDNKMLAILQQETVILRSMHNNQAGLNQRGTLAKLRQQGQPVERDQQGQQVSLYVIEITRHGQSNGFYQNDQSAALFRNDQPMEFCQTDQSAAPFRNDQPMKVYQKG